MSALRTHDTGAHAAETAGEEQAGTLRVYVRADERLSGAGLRWRLSRQTLHRQLIRWAHSAGLPAAMAFRSEIGYLGHGPIVQDNMTDIPAPTVVMCVEIVGSRHALHAFVTQHHAALTRALVQYHDAEQWESIPLAHHAHHCGHAVTARHVEKQASHLPAPAIVKNSGDPGDAREAAREQGGAA